jgi:hypothetical protein
MSRNVKPVANAYKLLNLVVKHIKHFEQNPKQLAWVMMYYEASIRQARVLFDDWTNPKDAVIDLEQTLTKEQAHLVYDAWGITVSNYHEFNDPIWGPAIGHKPYKTLDEWLQLFNDPKYQYHDLFDNSHRNATDYLLGSYGTGYHWVTNKGVQYIARTGPSGVNQELFTGYTQAEKLIPEGLMQAIKPLISSHGVPAYVRIGIRNGKRVATGWERDVLTGKIHKADKTASPALAYLEKLEQELASKGQVPTPKPKTKHEYPQMCEYSNLFSITTKAHDSYKRAAARISAGILLDKKGKHYKENAPIARACLKRLGYGSWKLNRVLQYA